MKNQSIYKFKFNLIQFNFQFKHCNLQIYVPILLYKQNSSLFIDRFAFIIEEFLATTQHQYDTLKIFYVYFCILCVIILCRYLHILFQLYLKQICIKMFKYNFVKIDLQLIRNTIFTKLLYCTKRINTSNFLFFY